MIPLFQATRKICIKKMDKREPLREPLKIKVLSKTHLAEVEQLARLCNAHDGLDIKLNWDILRGHLGIAATSFLYYEDGRLVWLPGMFPVQRV
jgi:hypothetical protein